MLNINTIVQCNLPPSKYFNDTFPKSQIYLHHTASNDNPKGVVDYWASTEAKVATAFIVSRTGTIYQCFSSTKWAYHLGLLQRNFDKFGVRYRDLNKTSIGIELCNWGYLAKTKDGKYITYTNAIVEESDVSHTTFRGHTVYQRYPDEQLAATKALVEYLCKRYDIPHEYKENMFDVNADALSGVAGVWTHASVRADKTDCFPQEELIDTLKSLDIT